MPRKRQRNAVTGKIGTKLNPYTSKYGHVIHNSPEQTELSAALRRGSRSSGRKITLPKISKGLSDKD